jgi:hypothetical protein
MDDRQVDAPGPMTRHHDDHAEAASAHGFIDVEE